MERLYVIDVTRGYLPAALLTAAAYAEDGSEALLVQGGQDHGVVRRAVERFRPGRIYAMPGSVPRLTVGGLGDEELPVEALPTDRAPLLAWLTAVAAQDARGVVLFPAHSPSWAIKAAALAVRLGYLAWPLEEAAGFAYAAPAAIPVLVLGEAPGVLIERLQGREFRHLPGDRAVAQFLQEAGLPVDYVVVVNSADLEPPTHAPGNLATTWAGGLSLLAPVLSTYRNSWVIDARTPRPDPREVERAVTQKVADAGLAPEYLAILASPGAIPFITEPSLTLTAEPDPTRELQIRLNQDLYHDVATGRILGLTAGRVSLQLLTGKHVGRVAGPARTRVLAVAPEGGLAGVPGELLEGPAATPQAVVQRLSGIGLLLHTGAGTPESLGAHGEPLTAMVLPELPPAVVFAASGSTLYPRGERETPDGGFSFEEEPIPPASQIGVAFLEKGALAFSGSLGSLQPAAGAALAHAFAQAAAAGLSVGQALRAARNHLLVRLAIRLQSGLDEACAALARGALQQALLGDPALAPWPAAPRRSEAGGQALAEGGDEGVVEVAAEAGPPGPDGLVHHSVLLPEGRAPLAVTGPAGDFPFAVEETARGLRVHWLAPAAVGGAEPTPAFQLRHAAAVRAEGRIAVAPGGTSAGLPGAMEGTRGVLPEDLLLSFGAPVVAQTLSGPGGRWSCWLPAGAELPLRVESPLPLFRHTAEAALSYVPGDATVRPGAGPAQMLLRAPEGGLLRGVVLDLVTGRPLPGARVRVWQKRSPAAGACLGYVGEAKSDPHGRFEQAVPPGRYRLTVAHRTDLRYLPATADVAVYSGKTANALLAMTPGAVLTGLVEPGPVPPQSWVILRLPGGREVASRIRRDGRFELLAPVVEPAMPVVSVPGRPLWQGAPVHPDPGESLNLVVRLRP